MQASRPGRTPTLKLDLIRLTLFLALCVIARAATCPAGAPLGAMHLTVQRVPGKPELPIASINQIEEGDRIDYKPQLRSGEKRRGKVAIVLVASTPAEDGSRRFAVLEPNEASKAAQWTVPFRSSLAVYVYGPNGLSAGKLRGFLGKDDQLLGQLADFAEKTTQTETALQALAAYEHSGRTETLGAALQGFASQYGISSKIDRSAPGDQQTLALMRTLNPTLAAYDPISPAGQQRVSQTAGLATTVAGMFLGSPVGLAAGGTAMALNLKSILFPNTEFRSAFAPPLAASTVGLCGRRESAGGRTRLAFLWAMRIPDAAPPAIAIASPAHVPAGLRSPVKVQVAAESWKLLKGAREWALVGGPTSAAPVSVATNAPGHELEVDLSKAEVQPGTYSLTARWDWDNLKAAGEIEVHPLSTFANAQLAPESQARLQAGSGKQVVTMDGDDFQFVRKLGIVRKGDKYATPAEVPFSLPVGYAGGPQRTIEMQIDTQSLAAGEYALSLYQPDGKARSVDIRVLQEPPRLEALPYRINAGDPVQTVILHGHGLDRMASLSAADIEVELGPASPDGKARPAVFRSTGELTTGAALDARMAVNHYPAPLNLPAAIFVARARPRITEARVALPGTAGVALRDREIPAGVRANAMVRLDSEVQSPSVHLNCEDKKTRTITVRAGAESDGVRVQSADASSLFVSFDAGIWPSGCVLRIVVETADQGRSDPHELGRVIRVPQVESFQLSDEAAGEGAYVGVLKGRGLELIEKTGWDAVSGLEVLGLPIPVPGSEDQQTLRIRVSWPSPTPRAPLFVTLRGETEARLTAARP